MAVRERYGAESASMELWVLYRALLKSLQNGVDHCRSVGSYLKKAEQD